MHTSTPILYPVITAIVFNIVLGTLWYSEAIFGKLWASEHNFATKPAMALDYLMGTIITAIMVLAIAILTRMFHANTFTTGISLGILFWVGFVATIQFSGVIWTKKSAKAYLIDAAFYFVIITMDTTLLAVWW